MSLEPFTYRFPETSKSNPLEDPVVTIQFSGIPLGEKLGTQNLFWGEKSIGTRPSVPVVIKKVGHPLLAKAEKNILEMENHPNIIKYEWFVFTSYGISFLVMPVYDGDMHDVLKDKNLTKDVILSFFDQMKKAVSYIHSIGYIHRDIKLDNFLVKREEGITIVLADFGFSRKIATEKDNKISTRYGDGSPLYMAPELIVREPYPHKSPEFWALGVCFYFMLYRKYPFMGGNQYEVFSQIKAMEYDKLPENAEDWEISFFQNTFCHFTKRMCPYE